jgi:hypothetical protein
VEIGKRISPTLRNGASKVPKIRGFTLFITCAAVFWIVVEQAPRKLSAGHRDPCCSCTPTDVEIFKGVKSILQNALEIREL